MPIKTNGAMNSVSEMETPLVMTLSEAVDLFAKKKLEDALVIIIPDTGKAKFNGSHEYQVNSGKDKGKMAMSKAIFTVAELGSTYAMAPIPGIAQGNGDVKGLALSIQFKLLATPPNKDGKTVSEALNRGRQIEVVKAADLEQKTA